MKNRYLILPALAVTLGSALLAPPDSVGYSTLGGKLNTEDERHVRVFDNFDDVEANNNVTPDPDFPGYTGVELAIWKGCAEWSGEIHNNNGLGDPTQPAIGSSGANFDCVWQGNATAVGGTDDNVHSSIAGGSGGVLAYTESPSGDGWRIRYYEIWTWHDGPSTIPFGGGAAYDLQGVACHEYGHALGLGHSGDGGATMAPSIGPGDESARSINGDDQLGAQFIYDVLDLTKKAHIDSISEANGVLTITGTMFSTTAGQNEVWFTPAVATPGSDGTAVKVTGLSSSGGGTVLVCPTPAGAGPGDLLVRNQDITGPKGLSNALAFEPSGVCTGFPQSYCTAGTSASGCQALLGSTGVPSATALSGFVVTASTMEGQKDGLFFFAENGQQANPWGNGTSYQCVTPPVKRTGLQNGTGTIAACDGSLALDMNAYLRANPIKDPGLGAVVQIQLWYRDPASTSNQSTSLSDALEFVICE